MQINFPVILVAPASTTPGGSAQTPDGTRHVARAAELIQRCSGGSRVFLGTSGHKNTVSTAYSLSLELGSPLHPVDGAFLEDAVPPADEAPEAKLAAAMAAADGRILLVAVIPIHHIQVTVSRLRPGPDSPNVHVGPGTVHALRATLVGGSMFLPLCLTEVGKLICV